MPRSVEASLSEIPGLGDRRAWRHFGDGYAGQIVAARLQAYNSTSLAYEDVALDNATGGIITSSSGGGGGAVTAADGAIVGIGAVADVAWVSGNGTLIAVSKAEFAKLEAIRALLAGALTVNVGLTDTQLRASAVPVSGTVSATQGTSPWVTSGGANVFHVDDNASTLTVDAPVGTPLFARLSDGSAALVGQKAMTASLPVVLASDQASVPVAATLAAETTKVLGVTRTADGAGNLLTSTTNALDINIKSGNPTTIAVTQATAASLNATVAQGTAAALASAWPAKVTDGTNTMPTMDAIARKGFHAITDGTTAVKVTVSNAPPASSDGALLVNPVITSSGTILASASHGVATVNTDIVNYNGKGIRVWQDLTVLGVSSVCQFSIQEKDPVSGKFVTLLASAATGAGINSTGTAKLTVYPGLTAAANVTASDVVPVNVRIVSTVATAASTFSIGYSLIP